MVQCANYDQPLAAEIDPKNGKENKEVNKEQN